MTTRDLIALLVSYVYAFGLLGIAELVRRWRNYPHEFTRKLVHIGAGLWIFGILGLFDTWQLGLIPFASFVILNFIFYRYKVFSAMDAPDSTPGTVYFALSITILFALLWRPNAARDGAPIAAAAVMAMTWGDALASLVGRAIGRRQYAVLNGQRSLEGSAAMFLATLISVYLTLWLLPGSALSPNGIMFGPLGSLTAALVVAVVATIAEAVAPLGTDNLSVPLLSGLALWLISRA